MQGLIRFANLSSMSLSISGSIYNELNGLFLILSNLMIVIFLVAFVLAEGVEWGQGGGFSLLFNHGKHAGLYKLQPRKGNLTQPINLSVNVQIQVCIVLTT